MENKTLAERVSELEAAIATEREGKAALQERLDKETFERTEALLSQEHRLISAWRNVYTYRKQPNLRCAAIGGLGSALLGRSGTTVAVGGGLIALIATAGLTLHANYLLSIQNE